MLGLNIPLFMLICLIFAAGQMLFFQRKLVLKNVIFAVPGLIFSALLSVFTAPELLLFNMMMMFGALFLVLRYASTPRFMGGNLMASVLALLQATMIGWLEGPLHILVQSYEWFRRLRLSNQQAANASAALRGVLIALPIVTLFGLLLASADAVFGDGLYSVVNALAPDHPATIIAQLVLTSIFAWGGMAGFKMLLLGPIIGSLEELAKSEKKKGGFRLTMIESTIILGSVDVLFLAFVLVQGRYLFGGEANINATGYTYAEYARRGFYELLAVSVMTMALVIGLDVWTRRKRDREYQFRSLSITMIALSIVILVAALRRLNLYEDAYGFTRIRVMSGVFMGWLAILFFALIRDIIWRRQRFFWIACVVTAMGFVLTLNAINMDGFIASRNIDRYEETGTLDATYLVRLSDDAMPAVVRLLDDPNLSVGQREILLRGLGARLYSLDLEYNSRGLLEFHFGKSRARNALDDYRDVLEPYIEYRYSGD
jgi:hypothetical protein